MTIEITFWGVRGTTPVPGPGTLLTGGNTSCVEIRCGEQLLVLDAGSGLYALGKQLQDTSIDILLSHTHLDHIMGLPVFAPLYQDGRSVHLWAGHLLPEGNLRETMGRLMATPLFPLSLDQVRAKVEMHDFTGGKPLENERWKSAGITVKTTVLNHPGSATGYRIDYQGKSVCYITDYEHTPEHHRALTDFVAGTDLLIYDATYSDENYEAHRGWGHSTWQEAVELANMAGVGALVLFHHDPNADDAALELRRQEAGRARPGTLLAVEGMRVRLDGNGPDVGLPMRGITEADAHSIALVERLSRVGIALSQQQEVEHLLETILIEAKDISSADGGTLYVCDDADRLAFAIVRNRKLGIAYGGSTGNAPPMKPLPLHLPDGTPNHRTLAAYAVLTGRPVHVEDAYQAEGFDFSGAKAFDTQHGYRTQSVLAIPLKNHKGEVMGCLQLINARNEKGHATGFNAAIQQLMLSLASQAAIILDNKILIQGQKDLLEAFIKMIAQAIDAKSAYTGGHCERVPTLTNMLAQAACEATSGPMQDFSLTDEERYELHIAGWMHDCGKVITPVHIMDKSTKLEKIFDRIALVETRMEHMKAQARIAFLEAGGGAEAKAAYEANIARIDDDLAFLKQTNIGGEFMTDEAMARLDTLAKLEWKPGETLLTDDELHNMKVRRGTLTEEDRTIMNDHMVHTCRMLEALPFPRHLQRVPEYAGGHHERMDGKGYPKGIKAGEMSIPARMMAVADVFEALTAADRPYKPGKKLSEAMQIIGQMKKHHHLDPVIVDFFVTSGVYRAYAKRYLAPELIDAVDEAALLAIQPTPL